MQPLVSIVCFAYNHEKYIRKTLESFMMQKVNFKMEVVIHDDASSDNTQAIIKHYEEEYPEIIRPIYQDINQVSLERGRVSRLTYGAAKGKYIALCEGDDYWTDPLKLQKQVDFLEANPEYTLCFHNALILWDDKSQPPRYFTTKDQKETSTIEDVIDRWFIPSASMMFRRKCITPFPEWFKGIYNGDWALHMICANNGNIGYIDEVMSVYRKTNTNLSATMNSSNVLKNVIHTLQVFNENTEFKYDESIKLRIRKLEKIIAKKNSYFGKLISKNLNLKKLNMLLEKKGFYLVYFR